MSEKGWKCERLQGDTADEGPAVKCGIECQTGGSPSEHNKRCATTQQPRRDPLRRQAQLQYIRQPIRLAIKQQRSGKSIRIARKPERQQPVRLGVLPRSKTAAENRTGIRLPPTDLRRQSPHLKPVSNHISTLSTIRTMARNLRLPTPIPLPAPRRRQRIHRPRAGPDSSRSPCRHRRR